MTRLILEPGDAILLKDGLKVENIGESLLTISMPKIVKVETIINKQYKAKPVSISYGLNSQVQTSYNRSG